MDEAASADEAKVKIGRCPANNKRKLKIIGLMKRINKYTIEFINNKTYVIQSEEEVVFDMGLKTITVNNSDGSKDILNVVNIISIHCETVLVSEV